MPLTDGFVVYRRDIPEQVVEDKRLGRHVRHDSRSLNYRIAPTAAAPVTKLWERKIPYLNQGNVGSCVGNASVGELGTGPVYDALVDKIKAGLKLDEPEAVKLYGLATALDPYPGTYPPTDTGSDGLSGAQACQQLGLISGYTHALSFDDVITGLQSGPMIVGSNWYSSMDNPDGNGLVTVSGNVRGGHEYLCRGVDMEHELLTLDNSWGTGWGKGGSFYYSFASMQRLLSEEGDATLFIPISAPAPQPNPQPGNPPYEGVTVPVAARIAHSALRARMSSTDWLNRHFDTYFNL